MVNEEEKERMQYISDKALKHIVNHLEMGEDVKEGYDIVKASRDLGLSIDKKVIEGLNSFDHRLNGNLDMR